MDALEQPCTRYRIAAPIGPPKAIEFDGGMYDGGVIRGAAVLTIGEARGHRHWVDSEFAESVGRAINGIPMGAKSRLSHPGVSADGMAKQLGRVDNAFMDGEVLRGDVHLLKAAAKSPEGDLSNYVLSLAKEDPGQFGLSVAFSRDIAAEDKFRKQNTHSDRGFVSPERRNTNNYPHVRLARLQAVDVVDSPAANAALFGTGAEIEQFIVAMEPMLDFAFDVTGEMPDESPIGIHPQRFREYVARYLDRRGLRVVLAGPTRFESGRKILRPARPRRLVTVNVNQE